MTNFNEGGATQPGYPRVKYRKTILHQDQVRTLNSVDVPITEDPGAGRVNLLHFCYILKPAGSPAYALSGAGELQVSWGGSTTVLAQLDSSSLRSTLDRRLYAPVRSPSTTANNSFGVPSSQALVLRLSGSNEFTGGSPAQPFEVHCYYQTVVEDQ